MYKIWIDVCSERDENKKLEKHKCGFIVYITYGAGVNTLTETVKQCVVEIFSLVRGSTFPTETY